MVVVVPQRPEAGEEAERGHHGVPVLLGEDRSGIAVRLELLLPSERAQLTVVEQRAAGVAAVDVAVLVGDEERGELGAHTLEEDRVVVDDRTAELVGHQRHVPEGVAGDLLHVHEPLERLHPSGAGWQQ